MATLNDPPKAVLWTDLPEEWKVLDDPASPHWVRGSRGPVLSVIANEIPDTEVFRKYQTEIIQLDPDGALPLARTSLPDFLQARGERGLQLTTALLLRTGKPAVFPFRVFLPRSGVSADSPA